MLREMQSDFNLPTVGALIDDLQEIARQLETSCSHLYSSATVSLDELTLITSREQIVALLFHLRDDVQFKFVCLLDVCGVDRPERFEIVYHLLSPTLNQARPPKARHR
jgi:NADH-quinone oxidoreductase subunit C